MLRQAAAVCIVAVPDSAQSLPAGSTLQLDTLPGFAIFVVVLLEFWSLSGCVHGLAPPARPCWTAATALQGPQTGMGPRPQGGGFGQMPGD